ncbi:hypothetical protein DFQ26_008857 [Actinomortierella ambigua]|nr:hypothetical protein DFQ26_008857 [Actinomortierella ambigua]
MTDKGVTASVEVSVEVTHHDAPHDDPPKADEAKKDAAPAAAAADGEADTASAGGGAAADNESEGSLSDVESGYLHKKGTNPINPWNKRFFVFGDEPVAITHLQSLHKRNERRPVVKASSPAPAAPAATAAEGSETTTAVDKPAAAAEGATSGEVSATASDAGKDAKDKGKKVTVVDPPKEKTKDVYETANKDLLVNIAHATQTGKGLLFYHKSDNATHVANPLGVINLRDVNAVEKIEKSSKGHSFVVKTKSRDYHFAAGSDREAKSWVRAIQDKSDSAKSSSDPYDSPQFQQVYQKLVAREAFEHAKNSASILSDNEPLSDGEPEDIEVDKEGKPLVKKRKSFFNFSVAATSNERRKAEGVTTEVKTEEKKDLMHVEDDGIDAFKAAESSKAVSHSTDAPTTAKGDPLPAPPTPPKSPAGGSKANGAGFKLFGGKKKEEAAAPPSPPAEKPQPLSVEGAKAEALKAVDEAVEASKAKTEEVTNGVAPAPPPPERKLSFFEKLFAKKPVAPPPPPPPVHEETVVVATENRVADVVTETGVAHTQASAGFFSKLTQTGEKKEVEVKSAEIASEDLQTTDGEASHIQRIQGTDANAKEGEVNLSTVDETVESSDKPEKVVQRKPSVLKRLGDAVGLTKAVEAPKTEGEASTKVEEAPAKAEAADTKAEAKTETPTVAEETEDKVKDAAVAEAPKEEVAAA